MTDQICHSEYLQHMESRKKTYIYSNKRPIPLFMGKKSDQMPYKIASRHWSFSHIFSYQCHCWLLNFSTPGAFIRINMVISFSYHLICLSGFAWSILYYAELIIHQLNPEYIYATDLLDLYYKIREELLVEMFSETKVKFILFLSRKDHRSRLTLQIC